MCLIVRSSLFGKLFFELRQLQRTLDFACGKGSTSKECAESLNYKGGKTKELLSCKITGQRLRTRVVDQNTM